MHARMPTMLLAAMVAAMALQGQDQPAGADTKRPISTDRPAFTDSSEVVPAGSFQLENGFLDTAAQGQSVIDAPESLVRIGLAKKTELRFTVSDYFYNLTTNNGIPSGWGDLAIGVKQQLGPVHKFDISVVAFVSLPTGANGVSSGGYDPGLQVPWSRPLSANWTAAGMFSVYWPTQYQSPQGRTRNVTGQTTFLFDRQLTKPWDAFVEYAGSFPEIGGPSQVLHFGTAFKVTNQQQIDFHVGVGLSSAAPDYIIGGGYSFNFQAIGRK
jgi:hypothetical protein